MSEQKPTSGVRTDLSPSEFWANMKSSTQKESTKKENSQKVKGFFGKLGEILSSFGIIPVIGRGESSRTHRGGHSTPPIHSGSNFRETYHVDTPPRRTHEDRVREHMAFDAYMDLVDGKGDRDCGHDDR